MAIAILCLAVSPVPLWGCSDDLAEQYLKCTLDGVIAILQQQDIRPSERQAAAMQMFKPAFDMPLMAKLAAGREIWTSFSEQQQQAYTDAFTKRLEYFFSESIVDYKDETIEYRAPILANGRKVHIPVDLILKEKTVAMLYKLYRSEKGWKIYDVEIEGVSTLKSYHSQIKQILHKDGFQRLIQKLADPSS